MNADSEIKTEDLFREDTAEKEKSGTAKDAAANERETVTSQAEDEAAGTTEEAGNAETEEAAAQEAEAEGSEAEEAEAEEAEADKAESDSSDEADKADEEADGKGRRKASRRDKKALAKKDEEIANLTDQYRRAMAEFDNYRKRTEKEKASMYGMGVKDIIEKILPVVDNFERGLGQIPEGGESDAFVQGMQAIYKQFMTVLDGIGVKPIEAVGQPFDPSFHNAVMHVDDEEAGDNVVVEEFQKGYMYKDTVVRYSMVKVAN